MLGIRYLILFFGLLGLLGLISFLLTKLILWFLPERVKNKKSITIIFIATIIIQMTVLAFFYTPILIKGRPYMVKIRYLDRLVQGKIAYDIPDTMEISQNYKAIVTISKSQNDRVLFQNIDSSDFEVKSIKISSRVKMFLIDPTGNQNFQITSLNTDEQLVDDSTNTIWKWNIVPLRSGENELILRTTVKILDDLGEIYKDIPVFEKHIKVNASIVVVTKQFIGDYWQWLSTVIFIPIIIWGYKKFFIPKKDNDKRNPIGFKRDDANKN